MSVLLQRVLAIADVPEDEDDSRLRKRVGIVAGLFSIVAPLTLTFQGQLTAVAWALAVGMSTFTVTNLAVLARTRNFHLYVTAMLLSGVVFVPVATVIGGGVTGSTSGLVFAFLLPGYSMLALGTTQATRWFGVYVALTLGMAIADPIVYAATPSPPYALQLIGSVMNTLIPLSIVFVLLRYIDVRRRAAEARVDELLTNAIPRSIATRLKRGEQRIAEAYPETTVLFADIVGFTAWTQRTAPERVVTLLDELFSSFDELAERHGVEKIKTIGDNYMAVAGAPEPQATHAEAAVALARDMQRATAEWCATNDLPLSLRVGLASGPVVAGVIGTKRILFDLWGDTVNVAARMESSSEPGRIQLAASTMGRLADGAGFEQRDIVVKDLGRVSTWLSKRI